MSRYAVEDKVEIIGANSPYCGKTGVVKKIICQPLEMINHKSEIQRTGIQTTLVIKIEGIDKPIEVKSEPIPLESQVIILK